MEKLKQFAKENTTKVFIVWLCINTFSSLWGPSKDVANYISNDNVQGMIQHVIAQSIKESLEKSKVDYSLKLIQLETKNIREPREIDEKVIFWKTNKWNAQVVALKIVLNSEYAKKQLRETMYNDLVYKALISHR